MSHVGDHFHFYSRSKARPRGGCCRRRQRLGGPRALCRLGPNCCHSGNRLPLGVGAAQVTGGWGRGTRGRALLRTQRASGGCLVAGAGSWAGPLAPHGAWPGLAQAPAPCPQVAATLPSTTPRLHLVARCCLQPLAASSGWGDTGRPRHLPALAGCSPGCKTVRGARACLGRPRSLTSKAHQAGQRACSSVPGDRS